jgi:hypothetical protein
MFRIRSCCTTGSSSRNRGQSERPHKAPNGRGRQNIGARALAAISDASHPHSISPGPRRAEMPDSNEVVASLKRTLDPR